MSDRINNTWGHQVPTPQSVLVNPRLTLYIDGFLGKVLALYGLRSEAIERFKRVARTKARLADVTRITGDALVGSDTLVGYERDLKAELIGITLGEKKEAALTGRAGIIVREITPYLFGDSLLDIGCGNGLVADLIRDRFSDILLTDVVKYVPGLLKLPYAPYVEGRPLPIDHSYDTVLLLTVLHHAVDPRELLKLAWGATKKRLIIIESVVGVHQITPPVKYDLVDSSDDDQIAFAAFVDWFYNRVLHDNVPVPYNFTTPEQWQSFFLQHNMRLAETVHLGQDIDVGPEYHILFVLDK